MLARLRSALGVVVVYTRARARARWKSIMHSRREACDARHAPARAHDFICTERRSCAHIQQRIPHTPHTDCVSCINMRARTSAHHYRDIDLLRHNHVQHVSLVVVVVSATCTHWYTRAHCFIGPTTKTTTTLLLPHGFGGPQTSGVRAVSAQPLRQRNK